MPADSDPLPALPLRYRPLGVRFAAYLAGGLLCVVCLAVWIAFPPEIRAKFTVTEKRVWRDAPWPDDRDGGVVRLAAVYETREGIDGNAAIENHIFGKATPWGNVEMGIANPDAFDRLEKGRAYYVDFIPCPQDGDLQLIES